MTNDDVNFLVMDFKERFEASLIEGRLNQRSLCEELGIANAQTVTHWITRKGISKKWQFPVCDRLGVHVKWMQTGEEPRCIADSATNKSNFSGDREGNGSPAKKLDDDLIEIPQHNEVSGAMGNGTVLNDQPGQITGWRVTKEWANKNIPANTGDKNLRIVTGFGDSMKGMFNSGDPLLIDTGVTSVDYDGVYFFRVGNEGFIKRLQRIPGNGIIVISNNHEYRDWTITKDMDVEVFGRVLKVWSGTDF